jgi:hypothetical protein
MALRARVAVAAAAVVGLVAACTPAPASGPVGTASSA